MPTCAQSPGCLIQNQTHIHVPPFCLQITKPNIIVLFLFLDLSDVHSDDDEKENISPDDLPAIVPIDTFGESFEEAVSIYHTVKPPTSDHPKCQAWVVAYGSWSLMRAETILGQNFALLAYGNCKDLPRVLSLLFM